jgi:uncharacterized repeat protein (TIGR02543 family)
VTEPNNSSLSVLLGNGSGGFTAVGSPITIQYNPWSVAVGDFNGDGIQDLATANLSTNNVTVLLGDGAGGFAAAPGSPFPVGMAPYFVVVGDFNGDGIQDLATANSGSNNVTILLGNGSGGFTAAAGSPYAVGSTPVSLSVGDLNGDGIEDLAVANSGGANVTVLLSFATGQASQTIMFGVQGSVLYGVSPFPIGATSTSGLAVTFASTTPSVCTTSGNTVTIAALGTCSIVASQLGNATYAAAATVTQSFTVTQPPTMVTIQTIPVGLQFSVDGGAAQIAPQTVNLTQGTHTIAVAATQAGATGAQYVFTGWSDSGAASHSIAIGSLAATYTASFQTQYQLSISAAPSGGGEVTPATGMFYNAGAVVPIAATANAGYVFNGWTGSLAAAGGPTTTVTMSAPESVTANFQFVGTPAPAGVSPAAGSGTTQTFTFSFTDPAGYSDLAVLDVLINNYLDGISACYMAYVPTGAATGYLYLVADAGGGYVSGSPMLLSSGGTLQNSQCTINTAGSSASASGNTLTLNLAITFAPGFGGNKIFYTAARSNTQNSGWQALGTWSVPTTAPTGPAVGGVSPGRSTTMSGTYSFTFTDTNGYSDLGVLDILTNGFLDGISACYVAYVPTGATTGYLYLVDDAGDGGYASGSPMLLSSGRTLQNSQCTINTAGSSASASGNTLTLNLEMTFSPSFAGNQIFYVAARNNGIGNSGWQAIGSVTVH